MRRWYTTSDTWTGDDKLAHGFGAYGLTLSLAMAWSVVGAVVVTLLVGVAIEGIELYRYRRWEARGRTGAWPFLADLVSFKDLAVDTLGTFAAVGFLWWWA